jgi:hypothetical protein
VREAMLAASGGAVQVRRVSTCTFVLVKQVK